MKYTFRTNQLVPLLKSALVIAKNTDNTLPGINGVAFIIDGQDLTVAATDRFRLFVGSTKDTTWDGTKVILLPLKDVEQMWRLVSPKTASPLTTIDIDPQLGFFVDNNGTKMIASPSTSQFPKIETFVSLDDVHNIDVEGIAYNPKYLVQCAQIAGYMARTPSTSVRVQIPTEKKPTVFTMPADDSKEGLHWKLVLMPVKIA